MVSTRTCTPLAGVQQCRWVQAHLGAPQVSHGDQCFLVSKKVLSAHWGHGLGHLYTTVLRELRLWRPPPGSASVAGVLPLCVGSGGTSRALLLSAESSRSAREVPAAGTGCSRRRGDAPSPPPSPWVGGLASAGSKASSSAGRQKGISRMGDLAQGRGWAGEKRDTSPAECSHGTGRRGKLCSPPYLCHLGWGEVQGYSCELVPQAMACDMGGKVLTICRTNGGRQKESPLRLGG